MYNLTGVEFITNLNVLGASDGNTVSFWVRNLVTGGKFWYGHAFTWSNNFYLRRTGTQNPTGTFNSGIDLNDGNWHFMTFMATGGSLTVFVDGNLELQFAGSYVFNSWRQIFNNSVMMRLSRNLLLKLSTYFWRATVKGKRNLHFHNLKCPVPPFSFAEGFYR